ncbi:MAG: cation:proton antiporter [Solirubrobacterales bacterium]|nr:cation:proton antiporter [Solirubrobacterales bacterium]
MIDLPAVLVVRPGPFLTIVAAAAVAGAAVALLSGRGIVVPVVVVEVLSGVIIGPHGLGTRPDSFITFFANLGLALLFYFAGYEIDFRLIRGRPLRLALVGWALSLALAYGSAGILALVGVVISGLYTGSALTTTAIGTLIPILSDSGELRSRFGTYLLAAGAVGEFGPLLVLTLVLSAQGTVHNALILIAFVLIAVVIGTIATRSTTWALPVFERTLESSSQLVVRWTLVLIFALVVLAAHLGLDLLLGGFAAGIITRQALGEEHSPAFDSKLTAVAFGVFVPFFFIVSGMKLDLPALFAGVGGPLKMLLFLGLFLVVRGVPAMVLYRGVLPRPDRIVLALMSATQLPLVLAITDLATTAHHMRASTAAALVGAAVLSTLIYPVLGLRLRGDIPPAPTPWTS